MQVFSPRKQVIVVLGARSGTSALSGALSLLGAGLPQNLMLANWANPKGYFEPQDIAALHDEILASVGSSWSDWRVFPKDWFQSAAAEHYATKLTVMFLNDYQNAEGVCILKEPRICRLLPLWETVFRTANVMPLYCFIDRAPAEVAASLAARDGSTIEQGLLYYIRNHIESEQDTRDAPRAFVSYDALLDDWRAVIGRAGRELDIPFPLHGAAAAEVDGFLERGLRHQTVTVTHDRNWIEALADTIHHAFTLLADDPSDPVALAMMDHARVVFAMREEELTQQATA
ncbi:sulfotransferase family protein [Acetobacter conturbans]|uniref:Sulfotransferase family protein n=1 Tax=Acetobacter conturbans TaxID=1737472 RepID=A0ABX0JWT0_9PROT|nr:hypothetical protein [Acetobacter conturbans]NHN87304.1 hypothetical protein [Acetobacter conturbans]